eukprot:Ihof_evm3s682 gene=Ihof_evmTU3s682
MSRNDRPSKQSKSIFSNINSNNAPPRSLVFGEAGTSQRPQETIQFGVAAKPIKAPANISVVAKNPAGNDLLDQRMGRASIHQSGFVGLYDFKETVGEGHFGVVKLATHALTKEKVREGEGEGEGEGVTECKDRNHTYL